MSQKLVVSGDKAPTYYNADLLTFQVEATPKIEKMISTVHTYACSLIDIWRSFGNDYVMTRMAM